MSNRPARFAVFARNTAAMPRRFLLCTLAAAALLCGCEAKPKGGTSVTGTVTYNGVPVEGATVSFVSAIGSSDAGFALTNEMGKFSLRSPRGEGVPPGSYQVTITKNEAPPQQSTVSDQDPGYKPPDPDAPAAAPPKDLLPAKYKKVETSELTATVTEGGPNDFTFPLGD